VTGFWTQFELRRPNKHTYKSQLLWRYGNFKVANRIAKNQWIQSVTSEPFFG